MFITWGSQLSHLLRYSRKADVGVPMYLGSSAVDLQLYAVGSTYTVSGQLEEDGRFFS